MNINKFTRAWRLLKTWPLLVIFGMISCVDVVQERVNSGSYGYGSDNVEMLPANLNLALDDSGFFLANASDITSIAGKIIGCTSGVERDVEAQEPTLQSDGSVSLSFDVGTGDSDCFFAITELFVDGKGYSVEASETSDPAKWAKDYEIVAQGGDSSAVIKVVDNINNDMDVDTGAYSDRSSVDATFTVITKFVGSGVSASFKSDAGSSSSATNVPNFSIEASQDGSTSDSFNLGRIRGLETEGRFYLLNMQLECPTSLEGDEGTDTLSYVRTCDGVTIDGTKNHSDAELAEEGDLLWRFALRNRATTSSSDTLSQLYKLSSDDMEWTPLNEQADAGADPDTENPGYKDKDGVDGCIASGSNYKACIRNYSPDEHGGFNLGLESSSFGLSDTGNPELTLLVELTNITDTGLTRVSVEQVGEDEIATATQDIAYFMLDIDLILE